MIHRGRGRPKTLPSIEERLGMRIEHHAIIVMNEGRTAKQIASALGIHISTLRRYLRQRGFRVECNCRLIAIPSPATVAEPGGPPKPGG